MQDTPSFGGRVNHGRVAGHVPEWGSRGREAGLPPTPSRLWAPSRPLPAALPLLVGEEVALITHALSWASADL